MRTTWAMGGVVLGLLVLVDCATAPGPQDAGTSDSGTTALGGGNGGGGGSDGIGGSGYGGGIDCGPSGGCRHFSYMQEIRCTDGVAERCEPARAECLDPVLRPCPLGQVCFDGGSGCTLPDGATTLCAEARAGCRPGRWSMISNVTTTTCPLPAPRFGHARTIVFQPDGGAFCSPLDPAVTWAGPTGCDLEVKFQARALNPDENWTAEFRLSPADAGRLTGTGIAIIPGDGGCTTELSIDTVPF